MTKAKIQSVLKYVLPLLIALGVAYGYVEKGCVCAVSEPSPPVVVPAADSGVAETSVESDAGR
jgi:hypothetical protein